MGHWMRIIGSLLIAAGVGVFVVSMLGGITLYIYSLFAAQDYLSGITLTGIILISLGFIMRKIFKEPAQKV
jgi:hypothetical protein